VRKPWYFKRKYRGCRNIFVSLLFHDLDTTNRTRTTASAYSKDSLSLSLSLSMRSFYRSRTTRVRISSSILFGITLSLSLSLSFSLSRSFILWYESYSPIYPSLSLSLSLSLCVLVVFFRLDPSSVSNRIYNNLPCLFSLTLSTQYTRSHSHTKEHASLVHGLYSFDSLSLSFSLSFSSNERKTTGSCVWDDNHTRKYRSVSE